MTGKRLVEIKKSYDKNKNYSVAEAVKMVKSNAKAKFDETVEIAMVLGVDPKHADQQVRGMVTLPNGTGKSLRVAVFARGAKAEEAKNAGADIVGAEDLAEKIQGGMFDFDRCVATPDMMAVVGKLGKILGTKGLMPNHKLGTVTMDVTGVIKAAKAGQLQYRTDSNGLIHAGIGKASFSEKALLENLKSFVDTIIKAKPAGAKGTYIRKVTLSSTQGAGVNIDLAL